VKVSKFVRSHRRRRQQRLRHGGGEHDGRRIGDKIWQSLPAWLLPSGGRGYLAGQKTCRKIEAHGETQAFGGDRQLRPGARVVRRLGADRRGRADLHDAPAGGNVFFRALRTADFDICELSMSSFTVKTAGRQLPLRRGAGLRLARVPPQTRSMFATEPHQEARGFAREADSVFRNSSSPLASGRASFWSTTTG